MAWIDLARLAPREREIAGIVAAGGEVSAGDVQSALADPLTNAAVRSMLRRLEAKGIVRRRRQGNKYLYRPAAADAAARSAVLRRVSRDHFGGSIEEMAAFALALAGRRPVPAVANDSGRAARRVRA